MYEIIEKQIEPSGQWRIRVIASESESMFLWFGVEPTQEEVDRIIDIQLRNRIVENPVVEIVDLSCSPWQFRKALNALGLRNLVEGAVAASDDQKVKDGWEFANPFYRYDPLVVSFGQQLGKSEKEMDQLFELAKTL
jgi:hypothetical protein